MTLPLPHGDVQPNEVRENFEEIARQFPVQAPLVTAMPATAADGTEVHYVADSTNGIVWRFRYRSASSSAYKWEFIGGSPLFAEILTEETTASAAYTDLATAGPSITLPALAGDYLVDGAANIYVTAAAATNSLASLKIGSAATSHNDRFNHVYTAGIAALAGGMGGRSFVRTAIAASTVLKMQYVALGANTTTFGERSLTVRPVRVA